jgi:hypothetical protein
VTGKMGLWSRAARSWELFRQNFRPPTPGLETETGSDPDKRARARTTHHTRLFVLCCAMRTWAQKKGIEFAQQYRESYSGFQMVSALQLISYRTVYVRELQHALVAP